MPLGFRQVQLLAEAADEVTVACPWVWICGDRRAVESLRRRKLVAMTDDAYGIMPRGVLALRRHNPALARKAIVGLRREQAAGGVMPWHING